MRISFCPTRPAHSLTWLLAVALSGTAVAPSATAAADKSDTRRAAAPTRPSATGKSTKAAKAAAARQILKSTASNAAPASATPEAINGAQLDIAARVLTGDAECEFNQHITVLRDPEKPGYFRVIHKNLHYWMVPRETSTGAVRLEDPTAGIVWLQIPTKSMLMNARLGQRLVDACTHAEQRVALAAVADAANALGILPTAAAAPGLASVLAGTAAVPDPSTESIASAAAANTAAEAAALTLAAPPVQLVQAVQAVQGAQEVPQAPEAPKAALTEPAAGGRLPL